MDPATVTHILARWRQGDEQALETLIPHVYDQLHRMAKRSMSGERGGHTLSPTALVHEAYLKLMGTEAAIENRTHFFAVASRVMRQVLLDHAKARRTQKRGGGVAVEPLDDSVVASIPQDDMIIELDDALTRLKAVAARPAQVIEMHYFGGLSYAELAAVMGVSLTTVERDLKFARAWLCRDLKRDL